MASAQEAKGYTGCGSDTRGFRRTIRTSLAEFELDLIRERTLAGLASARARGRRGGQPKALDDKKAAMARAMHQDKTLPVKEIYAALEIGKTTFYRYVKADSAAGEAV